MKDRLDRILASRGLTESRERARALVMEGRVFINDQPVTKPGTMIDTAALIQVKGEDMPFVGRGGLKLKAAIDHWGIVLENKIAMDIGSSTGGFTDCMLQMGAEKVCCVDVGYGQLDWRLRKDSRVLLFEKTNIRYLEKEKIPGLPDIVTVDLSFISIVKVAQKIHEFLREGGELLALIKPQFEVGKGEVEKGGIIRDEKKRLEAVRMVRENLELHGFHTVGLFESPVKGQKGNIEYFIYMKKGT